MHFFIVFGIQWRFMAKGNELWIHRQYLLVGSIQVCVFHAICWQQETESSASSLHCLQCFLRFSVTVEVLILVLSFSSREDDVRVDRLWGVLPEEPWSCCQSLLFVEAPETDPETNGASRFVFQHSARDGSQWKVRAPHTSSPSSILLVSELVSCLF